MLHLIPAVKELKTIGGELSNPSVYLAESNLDSRIETAVKKLPYCEDGIPLYVVFDNGMNSEE